ncbi:MAG TPA: hypothetical protein VJT78_12735 [Candidatus Dormibacteraeota bacterium]|nr:hypothetical protein [Candidatus Dormibacteraeota bacterium]
MAGAFAITTTSTNLKLPTARTGKLQFTVTNTSGRQLTARGKVVVQSPEQAAWFTIEGQSERSCAPNATLQYTVGIAVPPTAPAGPMVVRFDALGVENPDAYASQGPSVIVEVPPVSLPKRPFPWWMVAAAVLAVLLVAGGTGVAWYLVEKNRDSNLAHASPSPVRTPSPPPDPLLRFLGTWSDSTATSGNFDRVVIQGQQSAITATFRSTYGSLVGTGTYDPAADAITVKMDVTSFGITYHYVVVGRLLTDTEMVISISLDGSAPSDFVFDKVGCPPNCAIAPTLGPIVKAT